jgi:hypothetical protein
MNERMARIVTPCGRAPALSAMYALLGRGTHVAMPGDAAGASA